MLPFTFSHFLLSSPFLHTFSSSLLLFSFLFSLLVRISEMFVRMFSAFQSKQSLYIAMEFVQGGDCLTMLTARAR